MFTHTINNNIHNIIWKSTPISLALYKAAVKYSESRKDFAPSAKKQEKHVGYILYNEYDIKDTEKLRSINQFLTISRMYNLARVIKNSYKLKNEPVIADILRSRDCLALSKKYDLPPLNILAIIFENKYGKSLSNRIIKSGDISALKEINAEDRDEFYYMERRDSSGITLQKINAERSRLAELGFINKLRGLGIALKTEDELKEEGSNLTPDVLFVDEVYINDVRVYWIDYKDYAGTTIQFIWAKNKEQIKKYYDKWGYGAVCYSYSFVDNLESDMAMFLDEESISAEM
jgi:hypothetical protein